MNNFLDLPPQGNAYFSEEVSFQLHQDLIFVFGSNRRGNHGAGAAKQALIEFSAIFGKGEGLQGQSYAIPTKDKFLKPLTLQQIKEHVNVFLDFNRSNPHMKFFVTAVGTGYAGYRAHQIAPLFKGITNSWLPLTWSKYLK